ncbi:MAG: DUF3467 domain-containing protein [Deltaproteobacteria bacterium CG_4_8_14_3_um_filter_51_11]|nr:DUF3467 domain-containing protein [bacterium]OIP39918.1 MAG: hypothetical protein AUK25_09185 [Desulfobacteraceae bacterium CG2_30_51_40]PIP47178.1 MAG: hypothetical protein COX16_05880 [Deltaproteobacteria bacterium CG23_combo_of_CG06-09_8_20_14_all_51_20]PIX19546.1 MAG: DUF3467 domain-containing protein [Deltaproteobacteria bacterium CG_4_8_14_3_um_filter_51_11]PIY27225.1 MAG: DUF3467 domain-containing protein [Deltaproteobacteria bacterium CG_4_10_14_3_um_filter_51_14]PJB34350.1 MAG: DUF
MTAQNKSSEARIDFPKELLGGVYSNNMVVAHTKEEFIMDFLMLAPPSGTVAARIIISPGHMKRIVKALQENLAKYEENFGKIQAFEMPQGEPTIQ